MIKISILAALIVFTLTSNGQKKKLFEFAQYSFISIKSSSGNQLSSLVLDNLNYYLKTDGITSFLTASDIESSGTGFQVKVNGAKSIIYKTKTNVAKFDDISDTLYYFEKLMLTSLNKTAIINEYNCDIFITPFFDTLYLSKKLPTYINPLLLNDQSIGYGVVKAYLHDIGVFTLTRFYKKYDTYLRADLEVKKTFLKVKRNIFF